MTYFRWRYLHYLDTAIKSELTKIKMHLKNMVFPKKKNQEKNSQK